jgi:hypothetical protein
MPYAPSLALPPMVISRTKPGRYQECCTRTVPLQQVDQSNIHLIDATTVEMELTFSGDPMPVLPHPFILHATFAVKNGLITRLQDRLSPQTAQDLAALAPPTQLPKTGASDSRALTWLLALGLVCALAGALVRRAWLLHG